MEKILKGTAYELSPVLQIKDYNAYLLEDSSGWNWEEMCRVNLGRKRILHVSRKLWLILESKEELHIERIEFPARYDFSEDPNGLKHPMVTLQDLLRDRGMECKTVAQYDKNSGTRYCPAWERSLDKRRAIFSENGYALQYKGWLDYTFYQFEMKLTKRGWLLIGEHDVECLTLWNVTDDIMDKAGNLIEKVLLKQYVISNEDFAEYIKQAGLSRNMEQLRIDTYNNNYQEGRL